MGYHIVLHREIDLKHQEEEAQNGRSPRHGMFHLSQRLGAAVHTPHRNLQIHRQDRLRSKLIGTPENWALAREVVNATGPEDVIYCNSEVSGLPIAALCRNQAERPKIAIFVHNLDRFRGRLALRLLQARSQVDWFLACSQYQVDFLQKYLNLPAKKSTFFWDSTDQKFFLPGPSSAQKQRPLIISVGLEQRDYRTLAAATADLPVDVKISGFSKDARALARAFPEVLPNNMSQSFYEWPELLQLYRDADIVVVPTFPCRYAAGLTVMTESMACGRPTIVTATEGLQAYLSGNEGVVSVPPGDPAAMRQAIVRLLENREEAAHLAQLASNTAKERNDSDNFIEQLKQGLEAL
jgi:glycosyltransferase involved in cell wall biosynthesis